MEGADHTGLARPSSFKDSRGLLIRRVEPSKRVTPEVREGQST